MNCENHPSKEGVAACVSLEKEPVQYERSSSRGMPRPKKEEPHQKSNTFLLFCVVFLVTLIIVGVILYAVYVVYLAPYYGDVNSLINQLLNNPRGVINSLGL